MIHAGYGDPAYIVAIVRPATAVIISICLIIAFLFFVVYLNTVV